MDLSKIQAMLSAPQDVEDFDDGDLEAEIEAIVSGKSAVTKTRPTANERLVKAAPSSNAKRDQTADLVSEQRRTQPKQSLDSRLLELESPPMDDEDFDEKELEADLEAIVAESGVDTTITASNPQLIAAGPDLKKSDVHISKPQQPSPTRPSNDLKLLAKKIAQENVERNFKTSPEMKVPDNLKEKTKDTIDEKAQNTISSTKSNEQQQSDEPLPEMSAEEAADIFRAPPPPKSTLEALEQRIAKFRSTQEQAQAENNSSKARRLGRIVKQYENAIRDYKAGKTVDYDELPIPPGFAPIPKSPNTKTSGDKQVANDQKKGADTTNVQLQGGVKKPSPGKQVTGKAEAPPIPSRQNIKRANSASNKQLNYLLERQRLFKKAALDSKQKGDIQQAKEYLRCAKGFEPLIEATKNGLPIDATSIPTPPQLVDDFVLISHQDVSSPVGVDMEKEEVYRKVELELHNQIEMCKRHRENFILLGDVSTASKFEKLTSDSKKDLDLLIARWRTGGEIPSFKYEIRTFSVVICNTEVGTNEVLVEVLKGLDIPAKNDVDTFVRIEFPFPNVSDERMKHKKLLERIFCNFFGRRKIQDHPQSSRTHTVKNTINPVYDQTFKFQIDRKSRQLPRVFKRHPVKLVLFSKGGFLRSDSVIGTVLIKLTDLETKCTIHDSFPLVDGRKVIGGKIEARVRIREPLLAKQVEEIKEKWLIFT